MQDIEITVPWGRVVGKWWGPKNVRPILMVHGWMENAGTFDTLIPHLPKDMSYLAIDLPGHGLSHQWPHGAKYSVTNYVEVLILIQQHYKWGQISLCGHSMGAMISCLYAALYPERCDLLICFEAIIKVYRPPAECTTEAKIQSFRMHGENFLSLDKLNRDNKPPLYTYDEIVKNWSENSILIPEGVEHLTERGICRSKIDSNRFFYNRDIRLKAVDFELISIADDVHDKLIERITAPHLFMKATTSTICEDNEEYQRALDILKASNPKFEYILVDCGHHFHLTNPELISEHVSNFITKHLSKSTRIKHKM